MTMMNVYLLVLYMQTVSGEAILDLLQDFFSLTLLTVKMSLQQLLLNASKNKVAEGTVEMENYNEDGNHEFYNAAEGDDDYDQKSLTLISR